MKIHEIQHEQSKSNDDLRLERESLVQENQLFKSAVDQWSQQYEQIRIQNEQLILYENNFLSEYIELFFPISFLDNRLKKMN